MILCKINYLRVTFSAVDVSMVLDLIEIVHFLVPFDDIVGQSSSIVLNIDESLFMMNVVLSVLELPI